MISNFIDRVRLPFRQDKEIISALYGIFGFYPHNLEIYRVALAHKSQAYRNSNGRPLNNERLEFLGDAILEAVVSDIVYHRFERKREGFLTSTRSKIVSRSSLNKLAAELGLNSLVHSSLQASQTGNHIGGNAFEALMGAAYLDRGYAYCKWFIENRIIGRLLDIEGVANKEVNFKSKLLEWSQKNRILAEFTLESTENEGTNKPVFRSAVVVEGIIAGEGQGLSKKESQQIAAREALIKFRQQPQFIDEVFRAKEKRTAMEATEVCVLPDLAELDIDIKEEKPAMENPRPKNPHRNRAKRCPGIKSADAEVTVKTAKPSKAALKAMPEDYSDCREDIISKAEEAAFNEANK